MGQACVRFLNAVETVSPDRRLDPPDFKWPGQEAGHFCEDRGKAEPDMKNTNVNPLFPGLRSEGT